MATYKIFQPIYDDKYDKEKGNWNEVYRTFVQLIAGASYADDGKDTVVERAIDMGLYQYVGTVTADSRLRAELLGSSNLVAENENVREISIGDVLVHATDGDASLCDVFSWSNLNERNTKHFAG